MKIALKTINLIFLISALSCAPYKNIPKLNSFQDLNYKNEVSKIKLSSGEEIAYTDTKNGKETILFIHGLGSYIPAWDMLIPELSKKYRCIAIDLPGYGKSSKSPNSGQMTYFADVVNEFAAKLNLSKFSLAGHSMGGQISIVYSLTWPEKINKLILFAPAGFEQFTAGQKRWFEDILTPVLVKYTPYDAIETNLAYNFYKMPKAAEFMITDRIAMRGANDFDAYCYAVSNSVSGMVNQPVIDKLKDLQTKTLVFFGENDNLIPNRFLNPGTTTKIAERGSQLIPDCKLIMIPKCGHFIMYDRPDFVIPEIQNFIN